MPKHGAGLSGKRFSRQPGALCSKCNFYDRVMVAVARNSAREAEALEVNKLTGRDERSGGHVNRGGRQQLAEDSIASAALSKTPTATATEPIAIGAPSSVTKEGMDLLHRLQSGVVKDSLPPSMESEQSKQKKLAGMRLTVGPTASPL